jgi:hypothetical protein
MNDFTAFLNQAPINAPFPERIKGYSDEEITKIERLFDINITGEMKLFFQIMGRCSGGLISRNGFIIYRNNTLRVDVLGNAGFVEDLRCLKGMEFIRQKPFYLGTENETQGYFCLTDDGGKYQVYRQDESENEEDEDEIFETDFTFGTYMIKVSEEGKRAWQKLGIPAMVFETDLLEI